MHTQRKAELYLLFTTFIYGSTFVISKAILDYTSPLFYTGFRFLLAATIVFAFFYRRVKIIPSSTIIKGTVLGLLLFIGFATQMIGLMFTTASKSAFFTGMLVILTPIVHYAVQNILNLKRKSLMMGNLVGVVLSALGLYLMTSPSGGDFNIGDALTLICALSFAVYIVYLDFASSEPDKLQLTYVQFILCGVLGLIGAWIFESSSGQIRMEFSAQFIWSLLYLTIFATIISMWVQNRYQVDTTPTRAAIIFSLEPVIAAVFAYYIRDENIGLIGVIGAGFIMTGLLLSEFSDYIPVLKQSIIKGN